MEVPLSTLVYDQTTFSGPNNYIPILTTSLLKVLTQFTNSPLQKEKNANITEKFLCNICIFFFL